MWTRAQLKANAKYALRGRYGKCLLASLAVEAIPLLYSHDRDARCGDPVLY